MTRRLRRLRGMAAVAMLALAGCASDRPLTDPARDPWEPFNRSVHGFNESLDKAVLEPVARGYKTVTPDGLEWMLGNFFSNSSQPVVILNTALQGKFLASAQSLGRFSLNLVLGLGGLFDPATDAGLPRYDEDFGQTLAVWFWEDSRYLVLPVLGPSTLRDGLGQGILNGGAAAGTGGLDIVAWLASEEREFRPLIVQFVDRRARLLPLTDQYRSSPDPYSFLRDAYLQRREFLIYDGNPPLPDYDYLDDP